MQGHCKVQRLPPLLRESLGKTKPGLRPIRLWRKGLLQRLFFYRNLSESFFVTAIVANWNGSVISFCGWQREVLVMQFVFLPSRLDISDTVRTCTFESHHIRFCKIQTLFKEVALLCNYGCASNRNSDKPWAPWTNDADTGVTWQLWKPQFVGYEIHSCLTPTTLSWH